MERQSGVLLHVSSLPSDYGVGDFGEGAYRFIDKLSENGFSVWQILPFGPHGAGNSPYQAYSAYAGDVLFISPAELVKWGLLNKADITVHLQFDKNKVDYEVVTPWKDTLFEKCWMNFINNSGEFAQLNGEFHAFQEEHNWWLNDYALYSICKKKNGGRSWEKWPDEIKKRQTDSLKSISHDYSGDLQFEKFKQFLFFRQWFRLKEYAHKKGIKIFGDLPLYVSYDSADVWSNQSLFVLDEDGKPEIVGGVPPDYFSEDGQLWGNPVYNWEKMKYDEYQWWVARIYFNLHLFDLVRIDHFRGLESYWAIPASAETARTGSWQKANGYELLQILKSRMPDLPVIAEDLGDISLEVEDLRDHFELPGMKVLQFAFSSDAANIHLPHNYSTNNVVYTGTHDNNTLRGWWNLLPKADKSTVKSYCNLTNRTSIPEQLIEMAWSSVAKIAIVPMQDILHLGEEARMNTPGTIEHNWHWRYNKRKERIRHWEFVKKLNEKYNRTNG
ncbi:MAG: 4-alpha-glucanotransferase [Prolixibacteraceae bacterium]|nr:4-alpha-glucanotransferase [Prolixibacteraceae bacterium]